MDEGRRLHMQAQQARHGGRGAEALELQRRAVALFEAAEDADRLAHARRHLADMLSEAGAPVEAAPLYAEALAYYATGGAPLDAANAIRGAALNAGRLGDKPAAERHWRDARERYDALGVTPGVTEADACLAALSAA